MIGSWQGCANGVPHLYIMKLISIDKLKNLEKRLDAVELYAKKLDNSVGIVAEFVKDTIQRVTIIENKVFDDEKKPKIEVIR